MPQGKILETSCSCFAKSWPDGRTDRQTNWKQGGEAAMRAGEGGRGGRDISFRILLLLLLRAFPQTEFGFALRREGGNAFASREETEYFRPIVKGCHQQQHQEP